MNKNFLMNCLVAATMVMVGCDQNPPAKQNYGDAGMYYSQGRYVQPPYASPIYTPYDDPYETARNRAYDDHMRKIESVQIHPGMSVDQLMQANDRLNQLGEEQRELNRRWQR